MNAFSSSSSVARSSVALLAALVGATAGGVAGYWIPRVMQPAEVQRLTTATPSSGELFIAGSEEEQVVRVVKRSLPSVAAIQVTQEVVVRPPTDPFFQDVDELLAPPQTRRQRVGGGSGFFVSTDGLFVTNRHVVEDTSAQYSVVLQNGERHTATILDVDPVLDLAILRIEGVQNIEPLALGDSEALQVGQTVLAIGNALAEYQNSVTKGIVSGMNRRIIAGGSGSGAELIEEAIQTDAAINPGNSGGPLLNLRGEVIGVNTAVSLNGQSLGFAIPSNAVKRAIESVQKTGKIVRPWLGVRYFMINEESAERDRLPVAYGALISRGSAPRDPAVVVDSPADKAGIKEGDILLEIEGQKLTDERSLATVLGRYFAGDEISIKLLRNGQEQTVRVKLDQRTSEQKQ